MQRPTGEVNNWIAFEKMTGAQFARSLSIVSGQVTESVRIFEWTVRMIVRSFSHSACFRQKGSVSMNFIRSANRRFEFSGE
jgi:hypothetical protein